MFLPVSVGAWCCRMRHGQSRITHTAPHSKHVHRHAHEPKGFVVYGAETLPLDTLDLCEVEPMRQQESGSNIWIPDELSVCPAPLSENAPCAQTSMLTEQ